MTDTTRAQKGLEKAYGEVPPSGRKVTGDRTAPPAAATDTLGDAMERQADARQAQEEGEPASEDEDDDETERRRKRAYAI